MAFSLGGFGRSMNLLEGNPRPAGIAQARHNADFVTAKDYCLLNGRRKG
jgi:hypothetical protein